MKDTNLIDYTTPQISVIDIKPTEAILSTSSGASSESFQDETLFPLIW
jgi:hypothetical protein